MFLAYGLQFSYGVFVVGMDGEEGWSRADTALPYALYVFLYSALSAATGRATDRHGPRRVIALGAVLLGLGWGASALVTAPWQLNLTLGLCAAFGMSVAWVPCNATVARWFTRRRGTAVALASSGASFGNFVVPPLAALAMTTWGWRATLAALALASAAAILLAARHMVRDPESVGQYPDGEAPAAGAVGATAAADAADAGPRAFRLVLAMYFASWLVVFVPFVHVAPYAADLGLPTVAAASVLSAIGIGGVVGRLSSGIFSDRLGRLPSLIAVFALQALSFTQFLLADGLLALWLGALVFGFSYGGVVTLLPPLCGDLFGRARVASVVGTIFAVAGAPAAVGPWGAGWLYDLLGGYDLAFGGAVVLNLLALVLALVLRRELRTAAHAQVA